MSYEINVMNQWRQVQLAYIPSIGPLIANITSQLLSATQSGIKNPPAAEHIPLFLPSSLSSNL